MTGVRSREACYQLLHLQTEESVKAVQLLALVRQVLHALPLLRLLQSHLHFSVPGSTMLFGPVEFVTIL